jgi:hypothetical protein
MDRVYSTSYPDVVYPMEIEIRFPWLGGMVARKTVLVCDKCGSEVEEGKGAVMRVTFNDARRGAKAADLCDSCAGGMPGAAVARRGRKPKSLS